MSLIRSWTAAELRKARRLVFDEMKTCEQCDAIIERARGSTYQKFFGRHAVPQDFEKHAEYTQRRLQERRCSLPKANFVKMASLPPEVLAEREAVHAAERSISQELFGDPLPGRSALDRMRAGQS